MIDLPGTRPRLKALLIDLYQRKVHAIKISPDLKARRVMLNCKSLDRLEWERNWNGTWAKYIWFDASGAAREPVRPRFQLVNFEHVIAGYGLIMCAKLQTDELINCDVHPAKLDFQIRWEPWEKRLDAVDYFQELTRVPEWERV
jgi:hypothetical protein